MFTKNLSTRLKPFIDRGLIDGVPTRWQLVVGEVEMAPYVVLPDAGDAARYEGARFGHPLARTPIVLSQIGWEHFRIGHGLDASLVALIRHCAFVYHEGMPVYDLQLVQTHPDGLEILRAAFERIDDGTGPRSRKDRLLTNWVIPDAADYRRRYLEEDGFIDRAARFDYPEPADFLRPHFVSVASFCNYCLTEIDPEPPVGISAKWDALRQAATTRFRETDNTNNRDVSISLKRLFGRVGRVGRV